MNRKIITSIALPPALFFIFMGIKLRQTKDTPIDETPLERPKLIDEKEGLFKKEDICDECKVIQGEGSKLLEDADEIGK